MPQTTQWNWPRLRTLCEREAGRILRRDSERDDAVQEALIRAWSQQAACRTPHAPDPWVRQIARREALRVAVRRRRDHERTAASAREPVAPDAISDVLDRLDVLRALQTLSAQDRVLTTLRYFGDLTQEEIAGRLGLPVGTVKVRLHRVRRRLAGASALAHAAGA
ncbi:MAG TPA: sigma-70 family RNA polymerase sigma factor [Solirubrobacteraceae bacterium]|jgi:RNA polymerase sigma-70 factor (ECF subfamily)